MDVDIFGGDVQTKASGVWNAGDASLGLGTHLLVAQHSFGQDYRFAKNCDWERRFFYRVLNSSRPSPILKEPESTHLPRHPAFQEKEDRLSYQFNGYSVPVTLHDVIYRAYDEACHVDNSIPFDFQH